MPVYTATVTAAVGVVGANILDAERWARSPANRVLRAAGFTGSAVIGDAEVDYFIDEVRVGSGFNTALLVPQIDRDLVGMGDLMVPAGAELQAVVIDALATSPGFIIMSLEDLPG